MRRSSLFGGLSAMSLLVALLALVLIGGGVTATAAKKKRKKRDCKPATNIEAIVDDSGSMASSDPARLRVDLLRAVNGSYQGQLGGVEFGSSANSLFPPQPMPVPILAQTSPDTMKTLVDADNGGTSYNAGFIQANAENPKANARIFLSDGQPTDGITVSHKSPNIRTIVIATGDISTDPTALATLSKIAKDTGGPPVIPVTDPLAVNAAAADVVAGLLCAQRAITIGVDQVSAPGQVFTHSFKPKGSKATVLTTWPVSDVNLDISANRGQVGGSDGETFASLRLSGLKPGKRVDVSVNAVAVGQPTTATTRVVNQKKKKKKRRRR